MMKSLRDIHLETTKYFKEQGISNPSLESRLLLSFVYGLTAENFIAKAYDAVDERQAKQVIDRRLAGEPISKITGEKEFWSHMFFTSDKTLDPRPDSEVLIESVLKHLKNTETPLRILDMGTGTGCLLLTLLLEYKQASGIGVDISSEAIKIAEKNARKYALESRVKFVEGTFDTMFDEPFDLVISNPPYIPSGDIEALTREVKAYDPKLALDGGIDGLDPYKILRRSLLKNLKNKGLFVLEFGIGQADDICSLMKESGLDILEVNRDIENRERCVIGQNHS